MPLQTRILSIVVTVMTLSLIYLSYRWWKGSHPSGLQYSLVRVEKKPFEVFIFAKGNVEQRATTIFNAHLEDSDIEQIFLQQDAIIALDDYPNERIKAKVVAINGKNVDVLPMEIPSFMKDGMKGKVKFFIELKKEALILPLKAIKSVKFSSYILRPNSSSKIPDEVVIQTGRYDQVQIEVLSGLKEGDEVLVPEFQMLHHKIPAQLFH